VKGTTLKTEKKHFEKKNPLGEREKEVRGAF